MITDEELYQFGEPELGALDVGDAILSEDQEACVRLVCVLGLCVCECADRSLNLSLASLVRVIILVSKIVKDTVSAYQHKKVNKYRICRCKSTAGIRVQFAEIRNIARFRCIKRQYII